MIYVLFKSHCGIVKSRAVVALSLILATVLFVFSHAYAEELPYSLSLQSRVDVPPENPFSSPPRLFGGKFLVASQTIKDLRFSETVILLVKHDLDGSMGLVINRPTAARLSHALPEIKELAGRTDFLYFGGPVFVDRIAVLFQSRSRNEESVNVFEDIFIS